MFSFKQYQRREAEQILPGSGVGGWVMAQTMYTHLNKCKNNKRRKKQNCCFK
jgi:hypothetical protein